MKIKRKIIKCMLERRIKFNFFIKVVIKILINFDYFYF